jgi:hypothetical protein
VGIGLLFARPGERSRRGHGSGANVGRLSQRGVHALEQRLLVDGLRGGRLGTFGFEASACSLGRAEERLFFSFLLGDPARIGFGLQTRVLLRTEAGVLFSAEASLILRAEASLILQAQEFLIGPAARVVLGASARLLGRAELSGA